MLKDHEDWAQVKHMWVSVEALEAEAEAIRRKERRAQVKWNLWLVIAAPCTLWLAINCVLFGTPLMLAVAFLLDYGHGFWAVAVVLLTMAVGLACEIGGKKQS